MVYIESFQVLQYDGKFRTHKTWLFSSLFRTKYVTYDACSQCSRTVIDWRKHSRRLAALENACLPSSYTHTHTHFIYAVSRVGYSLIRPTVCSF
jgi:hypothetical protein